MSYNRPTQSKAQTESNAKILRALVKQPDNKVCVDCKRNDPRWASWNLGCFLCIRCSGIHRSMGTHISKVKSIDLDIWTPEQMASVQKWGNRRANLYWEAHLKAGHVPPDHKVESFIRSKYELKRWAKEGNLPDDPSVLDGGASAATTANAPSSSTPSSSSKVASPTSARSAAPTSALDLLGGDAVAGPPTTSVSRPSSKNLLDDDFAAPAAAATSNGTASRASAQASAAQTSSIKAAPSAGGGGGLFDLDWHDGPAASPAATSPTSPAHPGGAKGKNDILSLFASSKPAAAPPAASMSPQQQARALGSFSGGGGLDASFGSLSMGGNAGQTSQSNAGNPWSTGQQTAANAGIFGGASDPWASAGGGSGATSNDVWGNMTSSHSSSSNNNTSSGATGKNDAFADIWSDFK